MASAQGIVQNLSSQSTSVDSLHVQYDKSSALSESQSNWADFKLSSKADKMQQELQSLVSEARQFIGNHSEGKGRSRALEGLNLFEKTRVCCKKPQRDPTIFGLTRKNLKVFNQLLKNDKIPLDQRIRAAENLCEGLGVCSEGVSSKVQNETEDLHLKLFGLEGKFKQAKITTLRAIVRELVQEVAPSAQHLEVWEEHYVNDFNNALIDQLGDDLGIHRKEDAYLQGHFVNPATKQAGQLVQQFLTPENIVNQLTDEVEQLVSSSLGIQANELTQWDSEKFDTLSASLKANFAGELTLHDVIDLDLETNEISMKPRQEILDKLVKLGKEKGSIPENAEIKNTKQADRPSVTNLIKELGVQKISHRQCHSTIKISISMIFDFNNEKTEKKKKPSNLNSAPIQNAKALELHQATNRTSTRSH